ncbi:hypothetical protein BDV95DRAFT_476734, partial [Massariosphaeria phaeospora]
LFLEKRDNMAYSMPPLLVVFLAILGAALLTCCGFAIYVTVMGNTAIILHARPVAQDNYMREVRARNLEKL